MENPLKKINSRLKNLEGEVFPKEKKEESTGDYLYRSMIDILWDYSSTPLKKRVDNIIEIQKEDRKLIDLILDKLGVEYVKITEENGGKETREILRKKRKKSAKNKRLKTPY